MGNYPSSTEKIRFHVWIRGKVQGVGYRFSTVQKAKQLGVNGWVRNLPDGRVEAIFEGAQATVDEIIGWCNEGPRSAVVKEIIQRSETPEGIQGFTVQ